MNYTRYINNTITLTFLSIFVATVVCSVVHVSPASAQQKFGVGAASSITSKPDLPGPYTNTVLTLNAYSFDPNRANLTWYVDGQPAGKGVGLRSISVKTGAAGTAMTIQVIAQPANAAKSIITRTLRPAYVAITWEAETYTPPFYKGKALASPGATITYVAMPFFVDEHGKPIDPSTLVYSWKEEYIVNAAASGYGKRTYTLENNLRNTDVSVEVATVDKTLSARAIVSIPRVQPFIEAYALNPLLGVKYENAIGSNYQLSAQESTLVAEPFFFSVPTRESGQLAYDWSIGGTKSAARSSIVLRSTGTGAGTARITLILRHLSELLQSARKTFDVAYGEDSQRNTGVTPSDSQPNTYAPF